MNSMIAQAANLVWRYRGVPHYLGRQGERLGVTQVLTDRARNNQEIYRVSVLVSQLCERYHKTPKQDGKLLIQKTERSQILGTLAQIEQEAAKLHALAAAADEMAEEAYRAFDFIRPLRSYRVSVDFGDPIPESPAPPSIEPALFCDMVFMDE